MTLLLFIFVFASSLLTFSLSVFQVWEHSTAPESPQHWQFLSNPPSQSEVSHRCCDIHGRAAEEAGHGWLGECQAACYSLCLQFLSTDCSRHALAMFLCHYLLTVHCWLSFVSAFSAADRRLAVHRPGGGPSLLVVVCHHHHPGNSGYVPGCQFQLHTWQPLPIVDSICTAAGVWFIVATLLLLLVGAFRDPQIWLSIISIP